MINPTPVNGKNTPYGSATQRTALPKSIAIKPKKVFPWRRLFIFSFIGLIAASGTYVYAQINGLKNSVIIQHQGDSSSILAYGPIENKDDLDPSQFKKMGDGRFNVVIVGVGGSNHPGGGLTDSIQVMSIDTINKKVGMTSIPRDLYVNVPGEGYGKINTVYQAGEQRKKGDGALLMRQVVGSVLGVTISNFVLVDFDGAKQLVDAMGGIDVNVPTAINDPYFPDDQTVGYSPFSIKAGMQHLDGKTALRYARSRETTSDFDRSARQQLIIDALKKKALSAGTLSNPNKISSIITALGQHIKTDMQTDQILQFASIYRDINADSTANNVLDTSAKLGLLTSSTSQATGYISYPIAGYGKFEDVHRWFQKNNPDPLLTSEAATISVVAGNGTSSKQLQEMIDTLNDFGYKASAGTPLSNASKYTKSAVFKSNKEKKPFSSNYLGSYFGSEVKNDNPLDSSSDFEIIYVASAAK